jgi:hypothetical protein
MYLSVRDEYMIERAQRRLRNGMNQTSHRNYKLTKRKERVMIMFMVKEVWIKCKDDGKEYLVTELVKSGFEELVNERVFDNHTDAQFTLLALTRATSFALEHGLACPADFKNAIKKIKNLPRYKHEEV